MDKIAFFLIALLICLTMAVDLRYGGGISVFYNRDELVTSGYPRFIELVGLACACFLFFCSFFKKTNQYALSQQNNRDLNSVLLVFLWIFLLMSVLVIFKPHYQGVYRTCCLIPSVFFLSFVLFLMSFENSEFKKKIIDTYFLLLYIVITLSALVVVLSVSIDLGGKKIDTYEGDNVFRICGWGQDVSYQSCFCLWGFCFGMYYAEKEIGVTKKILNLLAIMLNICAIILTGAKTGYLILVLLFVLNSKKTGKLFLLMSIALLIYLACFDRMLWNNISGLLSVRTTNINMSYRDTVWLNDLKIFLYSPLWGINDYQDVARELGLSLVAHSQSSYFELLFWGGFPLFFLQSMFYYKSWKLIRSKKNALSNNVTSFFLVFLLFSTTEILFFSVQCYYSFLALLALMLVYPRNEELSTPEEENN